MTGPETVINFYRSVPTAPKLRRFAEPSPSFAITSPNCVRAQALDQGQVAQHVALRQAARQWLRSLRHGAREHGFSDLFSNLQGQGGLAAAAEFNIDLGKNLGVDERAMFDSAAPVDAIARAKRIQRIRRPGMFFPRESQSVDDPLARDWRTADLLQFAINELQVEFRIMGDDRVVADEIDELVDDTGKYRLISDHVKRYAMNSEG